MFLPVCVYAPCMYLRPIEGEEEEEGIGSPGTKVTDSCELPYGSWELNPGPIEEHVF